MDFSQDLDDECNVFIQVADDSQAVVASIPQRKNGQPTMASLQYDMMADYPYMYTESQIAFKTYADHKNIPAARRPAERTKFFSKGQPCLRTSALAKRYGWGFHEDATGKVAMYGIDSKEYARFVADPTLKHMKAMRSTRV